MPTELSAVPHQVKAVDEEIGGVQASAQAPRRLAFSASKSSKFCSSSASMLPWSRSGNNSATSPPTTTSSPPSHRRGSSSLSSSSTSYKGKLTKARRTAGAAGAGDDELQEQDDDCWDEGSDDEQTVAALALGRHPQRPSLSGLHISSTSTNTSTSAQLTTTQSAPAAADTTSPTSASSPPGPAVASPSSWSFNPFSIIAPSPKSPPPAQSLPGPEAVAQALSASSGVSSTARPQLSSTPTATTAGSRGGSYLANASEVQAEADRKVEQEERAKRGSGEELSGAAAEGEQEGDDGENQGRARRGSTYQMDQWKKSIKPNVLELVKGRSLTLRRTKPS